MAVKTTSHAAKGISEAEPVSLRSLPKGRKAVISSITVEGELGRRIRDMGLVPGAAIQVVGHAPLKDPVALRLMGFTLTLRNREADYILVLPVSEGAA